jgi:hypothetical protein
MKSLLATGVFLSLRPAQISRKLKNSLLFSLLAANAARRPVSLDCMRHHPVLSNQVFSRPAQIGRLCRISATHLRSFWSLRAYVVSGADFGGSVSASKNPVPGGKGSATGIRLCHTGARPRRFDSRVFWSLRYCCRFNPSASNCRLHSAGSVEQRATQSIANQP